MATKKTSQRAAKKPSSKAANGSLKLTEKERAALRKSAEADMKKHGFKTVEELTAYYDSKRGY